MYVLEICNGIEIPLTENKVPIVLSNYRSLCHTQGSMILRRLSIKVELVYTLLEKKISSIKKAVLVNSF